MKINIIEKDIKKMQDQINIEKEVTQMKQVFVSYHYTSKDGKYNGFGNYIGEFRHEDYLNSLSGFILELEETIAHQLEEKTDMPCAVRVMFFR